ncbi:MAG: ABC transporter ATP-binding protein [Sulfurospirillaceae bacterium]|nr:ABC transporter ATP-binding protein [Sulfurospirillaceae bacterium]
MASIRLENITNYSCKCVNLEIKDGQMMVVVGQTGAGKTTLLNIISGLVSYEGSVYFDEECMDSISPRYRDVGYLFQSFALFPNLTVRENIAFGLEVRHMRQEDIAKRVNELTSMLAIEHIVDRYPKGLSGGEKQRVAFARTLAPKPKILLLDEPFSSLDPRTASVLRSEIRSLQKRLHITTIFVTHNQKEAFDLADSVAVVDNGTIAQVGKPLEMLFYPKTPSVHYLLGSPTILKCDEVVVLDFGLAKVLSGSLSLIVAHEGGFFNKLAILSNEIRLSKYPIESAIPNKFKARVSDVKFQKTIAHISLEIQGTTLMAELSMVNWEQLRVDIEDEIFIAIPFSAIKIS